MACRELAVCNSLQRVSCTCGLQIFGHSDNPRVEMLMREGSTMLNRPGDWEPCVRLFSAVIEEDPYFAEVCSRGQAGLAGFWRGGPFLCRCARAAIRLIQPRLNVVKVQPWLKGAMPM